MVQYDLALLHVVHVDLLLQCLDHDRLVLPTVELVKHVGRIASERLLTVVFGQAALHIEDLAHEINHTVIEVEHDEHGFGTRLLLIKVLHLVNLVEDRVVNATATHQRLKLQPQNFQRVSPRHNTVVGSLVMRQFLLFVEIPSEFQTIIIRWILQIVIALACDELFHGLD